MHEYDVALKRILARPGSALLTALTGRTELRWLNVELPKVTNLRVDALGELPTGGKIHFEFQSRNDRRFAFRMAEYSFGIARQYGDFPRQIAIYVGSRPMRMKNRIDSPNFSFRFELIDIRDLDGEPLLASPNLSDNVIAVLTSAGAEPGALKRILRKIADAPVSERGEMLAELQILAGLRGLRNELTREEKKMPITVNLLKDEFFGPMIRKGMAEGREEGRAEGQLELVTGMIRKRFGRITPAVRKRLDALTPEEVKAVGLRILDARSLDDLFAAR
jgi:hypothetical protein